MSALREPLWSVVAGDAVEVLDGWKAESAQACVTSPPYFRLRDYTGADPREIGTEESLEEYVRRLVEVLDGVRRVLRPDGLLWLNLGDGYNTNEHGPGGARAIDRLDRTPCYQRGRGRGRVENLFDSIGAP